MQSRSKNRLSRALSVVLIGLSLVACQNAAAPEPSPSNTVSPNLGQAVNQNQVVILYNDSVPSSLAVQSGRAAIRPGTVDSMVKLGEGLSSQAYNPQESAQLYGVFLSNLIGRYSNLSVSLRPVSQYKAGDANTVLRTFYIGSTYNDPVPNALITDVMNGAAVTWFNYQIWQLDRPTIGASLEKLGLRYNALHAAYTPDIYNSTYNKIRYRGFTYDKYLAPMEMMEVQATRSTVLIHAEAVNAAGRKIPYAVQSGNFWFVADNPFTYMHETDRYLVFADLLGPMLGRNETCEPRALARMEDVSPKDPAANLSRMIDVYQKVGIPFIAATIPVHVDLTQTPKLTRNWSQNPTSLLQLQRVALVRGRVFQHGYTHQYEGLLNPYGVSAADFEFWRVTLDAQERWVFVGPIPGMTASSALDRINRGRLTLAAVGVNAVGWVTPHYQADPSYYKPFTQIYSRAMERRIYRVGNTIAGQFFPYPVRDVNGTLMLPETMGSIQPGYPAERMLQAARANRALRCPWAGHFNHPYTLDPANASMEVAISAVQFEAFLRTVQGLGYRYVDPLTVGLQ